MSYFRPHLFALLSSASMLIGCGGEAPADALRSGPALTETALAGMYMSRTKGDAESLKFVACLDDFTARFDDNGEVETIFGEISVETDTAVNPAHISYFTDQIKPERFKRLVNAMTEIDLKADGDLFNFDSSSTCVLSPEDCTLPETDAKTVRMYWRTIEHGSMGCYE